MLVHIMQIARIHAAVAPQLLPRFLAAASAALVRDEIMPAFELGHRDHLLKQESTRRRQPEPTGSTVWAIFSRMSRS